MSTRHVILDAIKRANEATVDGLAAAAEVSPVTVRHHLNSLQGEGLLEVRSMRRKVGRPYYLYRLSPKAQELFPQRYVLLSNRLLDELKSRFPAEFVDELIGSAVEHLVSEHRHEFEKLSFEAKLPYLINLLAEEGFLASVEATADGYRLVEHSCPYVSVGVQHQEICTFDKQLIQIVLNTEIKQHSCMLNGDSNCQFTFAAPAEVAAN